METNIIIACKSLVHFRKSALIPKRRIRQSPNIHVVATVIHAGEPCVLKQYRLTNL